MENKTGVHVSKLSDFTIILKKTSQKHDERANSMKKKPVNPSASDEKPFKISQ